MSVASSRRKSGVRALMATEYSDAKRRASAAPSPGPTPITTVTGLGFDSAISSDLLLVEAANQISFAARLAYTVCHVMPLTGNNLPQSLRSNADLSSPEKSMAPATRAAMECGQVPIVLP